MPQLLGALGGLWARGVAVDWGGSLLEHEEDGYLPPMNVVPLPDVSGVWQRSKCWPEGAKPSSCWAGSTTLDHVVDAKVSRSAPGERTTALDEELLRRKIPLHSDPAEVFYEFGYEPHPLPHLLTDSLAWDLKRGNKQLLASFLDLCAVEAAPGSVSESSSARLDNHPFLQPTGEVPFCRGPLCNLQEFVRQGVALGGRCVVLGLSTAENDRHHHCPNTQMQRLIAITRVFQAIGTYIDEQNDAPAIREIHFVLEDSHEFAPLVAFVRAARKEYPEIPRICIVALEEGGSAVTIRQAHVELAVGKHPEVLIDSLGNRHLPRLRHVPANSITGKTEISHTFHPQRWLLITGGTRGVGLAIARWALQKGARKLLFLARGPLSTAKRAELLESKDLDVELRCAVCDVGCDDYSSFLAAVERALPAFSQIQTIFHCAGVVGDRIVRKCEPTKEFMAPLVRAKLQGSLNVLRLYKEERFLVADSPIEEDFVSAEQFDEKHAMKNSASLFPRSLVFCSSSSATLGSIGQAVYCFANRFMDYLARNENGGRVLSIQWGGWETGMTVEHNIERLPGEDFLSVEQGTKAALEKLLVRGLCGDKGDKKDHFKELIVMRVRDWRLYWRSVDLSADVAQPVLAEMREQVFFEKSLSAEQQGAKKIIIKYGGQKQEETARQTSGSVLGEPISSDSAGVLASWCRRFPGSCAREWAESGLGFLLQHRFDGGGGGTVSIVPATFWLELMVAAAASLNSAQEDSGFS